MFKVFIYVEIWYNKSMDEKKRILKVLEKPDTEVDKTPQDVVLPKVSHKNQTSPIKSKLMQFCNSKIGDKFSLKDLLR